MEGELWLSLVPTVTVRGDVGLAFQLPSEAPRRKQWTPQGQRQDQEKKGKVEPRDGGSFFLAPATCGPPPLPPSSLSLLPARISVTQRKEVSSASFLLVFPVTPAQVPQEHAVRPLSLSLSRQELWALPTAILIVVGSWLIHFFFFCFFPLTCVWLFVIVSFHSSNHSLVKFRTLSELMTISVRTRNWPAVSQPPTSRILGLFKGRPWCWDSWGQ